LQVSARVHLVEIFLPLTGNDGERFPQRLYGEVRRELIARFGGLTAFSRSPAEGLWQDEGGTARDDIVIFEVMAERFDLAWWRDYRAELERRFAQDVILIRASEVIQV
jgi:hypothetical protein